MNYNRSYQLFLLFSLSLLLSLKLASGSTSRRFNEAKVRCIESERQALLEFKQGLIDYYAILSSWDSGEDNKECCKWWGVKCSNRTGHVIILDLRVDVLHYLEGTVSLSLLLGLQHLRYLDLSGHFFTGSQIGGVIGSFHRLKYLNLSYAGFTGVVPPQLGNLTSLESLDLGSNYGPNYLTINNLFWLSQLRFLRRLDISGLYLNSANWLQIIVDLPFLEELYLAGCELGSITSSSLLLPNSSSKSLSILDLSFNSLTSPSNYLWLVNISKNLARIDLSGNDLKGPIPDVIGEMISLEDIDMSENRLTGGIPNSFQNLSHLRNLSLSYNNLNEFFPELLQKLSTAAENSLEVLNLSWNQFYGPLTNITRFLSLRVLDLSHNRFNGSLMQNFVLPPSLEDFDLSYNQIIGDLLIKPFMYSLSQPLNLPVSSSSLNELYLNNNRFTGRVHESLKQFFKLKVLDLSSNFFEGTISEMHFSTLSKLKTLHLSSITFNISDEWVPPFQLHIIKLVNCSMGPHFPQWLITQNNLSVLDLSFNGISNKIPNWFWDLSRNSKYLNLSHNQITGRLPNFIPRNLSALYLQKNMFVGSISFLCSISTRELLYLDLSDNLFSGNLPNCWKNMEGLITLNLANNNFSGLIPESFGFLSVSSLHLRNNSFSGELPSSMKNCKQLTVLDVGENRLTGSIPSWIGTDLTNLAFLSLRSNDFYGNIPQDICHLSSIHVLDLSSNNISGKIPSCINNFTCLAQKDCPFFYPTFVFPTFEYLEVDFSFTDHMRVQWKRQDSEYEETLHLLKAIDISNNKLVGHIPEEMASLRGLISLNLSMNRLTANIINHIDQMEMLEALDLSRNQLSGEIPPGLARLSFLSLLDLSNNSLSGRIPSSTQLQSFNPSTYMGNNGLCGPPLEKCPSDVDPQLTDDGKDDNEDVENQDELMSKEFYMAFGLGFPVGLGGVVAALFKDSWRNAYFRFLECIYDWFYVTSMVYLARLRRTLRG